MPVRKRKDRRAHRVEFDVTPDMMAAFRAFIDSKPPAGSFISWDEHWRLHDLLHEAGALSLPFIPPCCFHPRQNGIRWQFLPDAVAIYRRLIALN